jgi:hypothetical protein
MEQEIAALKQQVQSIANGQDEMKTALKDISSSLKALTRLELQHNESQQAIKRAFARIDDHEDRVREIEKAIPTIKLATGWVFKASLGVLGILGTVAVMVVVRGTA